MSKLPVVWKPHPGKQEVFLKCPVWECLLHGNRGGGKGLLPEEKILTPRGWTTMGELCPGSVISNPDGTSQTVIQVFPRDKQQMFRLCFSDGTTIDCDGDHLWFAKIANRVKGKTIRNFTPLNFYGSIFRTEDLHKLLIEHKNKIPLIPCPDPIKYQQNWKYDVDSYMIGLILGDGCITKNETRVSTIDEDVVNYSKINGARIHYDEIRSVYSCNFSANSEISLEIRKLGLTGTNSETKFIPERLLRGSVEERLALLQGLMDSDGYVDVDGSCGYTTVSNQLAKDVRNLIFSLGGWSTITKKLKHYTYKGEKKLGKLCYSLYIQFPNKEDLFRLKRKKNRAKNSNYMHGRLVRKIIDIIKLKEKKSTICMVVSNPNRLFITKDFLVTHNTDVLLMDYAQGVGVGYGSDYRGLLLREATTELGDVIAKSKKWFPRMFPGCKYNGSKKEWTFPTGETLWLNYAEVESDYDQYHGHCKMDTEKITLSNGESIQAKNIKIGDFLQTLQGPKKVTKIFKYKKHGVKLSVFDSCLNLIGEQYQGVLHPVLTTYGFQRPALSYLFEISQQSSSVSHLIEEVQKFLFEIHQEILVSLYCSSQSSQLDSPIFSRHRQLFSFVHQTYHQLLAGVNRFLASEGFPLCTDLSNLLVFEDVLMKVNASEELKHVFRNVLQLLLYCEFLTSLVLQIRSVRVHQIQSMLFVFHGKYSSLKKQRSRFFQLFQDVKHYNSLQLYGLSLLMQDQISWNDTFAYVQILKKGALNYQDGYHHEYGSNDEQLLQVLGICQSSFPLQNDVPLYNHFYDKVDVLNILHRHNHDSYTSFSYTHPYTHESCQTKVPLSSFSFSVSACDTPFDMVDFEVEDVNHYISVLDNKNNNQYNHKSQEQDNLQISLVNQNSYPWIGWEEITNHPLPTIYLKMISCNRSSNPKIPKKIRATCNPNGPGHGWVKQRFIDSVEERRVLREDVEVEIPDKEGNYTKQIFQVTRTHIFLDLQENTTLLNADPLYRAKLKQITQDNELLEKAWIKGSWDLLVGGFFTDVWDPKIHILPHFMIPRSWKCFRSFDWGSSKPWSVTYFVESNGEQPDQEGLPYFPIGSVIVISEIYGWNGKPNQGDPENATSDKIAERVKLMDNYILMMYGIKVIPGPADTSIYDVKEGTSIGATMEKYGCFWTRAYKGSGSRIAGWNIIRTMLSAAKRKLLEKPHLYFFKIAVHHIRTIPIMQRDKKKPEDIDCFVSGTSVTCLRGNIPIEEVTTDDLVYTPIGYRRVLKCGISGKSLTFRVNLSNGKFLQGTSDHKIFVNGKGLVPLCKLNIGDSLWEKSLHILEELNSQVKMGDILNAIQAIVPFLTEHQYCTEQNGKLFLEKFQKDMKYITKTTLKPIAELQILKKFLEEITQDTTSKKDLKTVGICTEFLKNGEDLKKVNESLEKILSSAIKILPSEKLRAFIVVWCLLQNILQKDSAQLNVEMQFQEKFKRNVKFVDTFSGLNQTTKKKHKLVVIGVDGNLEEETVYNLSTEQAHLYYANDCLVSNTEQEDHCFHYDTEIVTDKGIIKIGDLVGTSGNILSLDGKFEPYCNCRLISKNVKMVKVTFSDGHSVLCTDDHLFLTNTGFIQALNLLTLSDTQCIVSGNLTYRRKLWKESKLYQKQNKSFSKLRQNGMEVKKEVNGIKNIMRKLKKHFTRTLKGSVQIVNPNLKAGEEILMPFVPINANLLGEENQELMMLKKSVQFVHPHSLRVNTKEAYLVHVNVEQNCALNIMLVESVDNADVYCLEVPSTHVFSLSNGVIVSNCMDGLRYGLTRKMLGMSIGKVGM